MQPLDEGLAGRLARITLGHVGREYPHKLDQLLAGDGDLLPPRSLHPLFHGSFDWHSCVHGWWTLLTLRRLFPHLPESKAIVGLADDRLSEANVAGELSFLQRPTSATFERPYGWAWLLALHGESARHSGQPWSDALEPLARAFAGRLQNYLHTLTYPVRSGTHSSTAFALILAEGWAREFDAELHLLICERASAWFADDRDCQAWEPGGEDFLSPALSEAVCMLVTEQPGFDGWLARFLPRLASGDPAALFSPAAVSDHRDGKIVHLDGLNLSRAWCWRLLAPRLPPAVRPLARAAAGAHLDAALPHIGDDYAGEHWLATFVLLACLASAA